MTRKTAQVESEVAGEAGVHRGRKEGHTRLRSERCCAGGYTRSLRGCAGKSPLSRGFQTALDGDLQPCWEGLW